jgi:AhpD family alkylhydroperoxidase
MNARLNYGKIAPGVYEAMDGLDRYVQTCAVEKSLIMLVQLRASQINGCAYCLDMHWKDLTAAGEGAQRLYSLDAWRECPYYTDRERAALAWTEAVTLIANGHVPQVVYQEAIQHFSEKELADLTLAVAAINAWNRLSIAGRLTPGTYQPAQAHQPK